VEVAVVESGRPKTGRPKTECLRPGANRRRFIERGLVRSGFELRFLMGAAQAKVSSQETHAQDSRDEILKAAMHLFANRGFHETSMSEVAREARVSKALIFWHFKTKEELFLAVLNRLLEPYFIDFAEEAAQLDERQQTLKLVELYLLFVRDNASSVRFFLAQLLREQKISDALGEQVMRLYTSYRAMLVDLITRGRAKGLCETGLSPETAAAFIVSALNGLLIEFLFMGGGVINTESAIAMVDEWLFRATHKQNPTGGKAVA
jgi:AcrR family transcriptional regulator